MLFVTVTVHVLLMQKTAAVTQQAVCHTGRSLRLSRSLRLVFFPNVIFIRLRLLIALLSLGLDVLSCRSAQSTLGRSQPGAGGRGPDGAASCVVGWPAELCVLALRDVRTR